MEVRELLDDVDDVESDVVESDGEKPDGEDVEPKL